MRPARASKSAPSRSVNVVKGRPSRRASNAHAWVAAMTGERVANQAPPAAELERARKSRREGISGGVMGGLTIVSLGLSIEGLAAGHNLGSGQAFGTSL